MIDPGQTLMRLLNAPRPETLYHYTSLAGVDGISTSNSVWATAAQYMNDAKEFTLAVEIARRQLESARHAESNSSRKRLIAHLRDQLERMEHLEVCIFSLSKHGDLLSQWRGYCPPNGGYSIGFGAEELRMVVATQGAFLAPCVYDMDIQETLISDALRPLLSRLATEVPEPEEEFRQFAETWAKLLFDQLVLVAPLIKHYSFEEEHEWRVIWIPGRLDVLKLKYRTGPGTYIPYACVSLQHDGREVPIHQIIVGPMRHQDSAIHALCGALTDRGFRWRAVRPSQIPYRTW